MARTQYYTSEKKLRGLKVPYDAYVTPDIAIKELLKRETFEGLGWEPASGTGAIAKFFPGIMASDIRTIPIIYGEKGIDFFKEFREVDYIVTNPPYFYQFEFVVHALECAKKVAMFLRLQFLESQQRYRLFKEYPPIRVYVFSNRVSCSKENGECYGGMICFCWFVWERGFKGKTTIEWILAK